MSKLVRTLTLVYVSLWLSGCSMTTHYVTKKCPPPVTAVLTDYLAAISAVVIGSIKINADKSSGYWWLTPGVALGVSAYATEVKCLVLPKPY